MPNGDWLEDTTPRQPVELDQYEPREGVRSGLAAIPLYVWLLGFVVMMMLLGVIGLWALYLFHGQIPVGGPTPTPIFLTPTPAPSPSPSPTATSEPTPTASAEIAIGRYVQVVGTEGRGVNLRSAPGTHNPLISTDIAIGVGQEGELFIVVSGPRQVEGITWWMVRDPDSESREGWAAGNYLAPVDHP